MTFAKPKDIVRVAWDDYRYLLRSTGRAVGESGHGNKSMKMKDLDCLLKQASRISGGIFRAQLTVDRSVLLIHEPLGMEHQQFVV